MITKILHLMSDFFYLFFGEHRHHHHHNRHQKVRQVLVSYLNNNKYIIMASSFASNQQVPITAELLDADSLQPITATKISETNTSDHPEFAVVDPVKGLVGVAPGTGNLTTVITWGYTDKNTGQPVTTTETTITPFTVTEVIMAEKVKQVVTLGDPQPQPIS